MGFLYTYEHGTLKPIEVIFRRGQEKRKNNRGDEPNQSTIYMYMEMSQHPP
jgi:hypothetical protein